MFQETEFVQKWFLGLVSATVCVLAGRLWDSKSERNRERNQLISQYLSQLQNATETLWSRLEGIRHHPSSYDFDSNYFRETNVYAVGRVLAIERLLTERGLYAAIYKHDRRLSKFLQRHRLDLNLGGLGFHRFERLILAETIIDSGEGHARLIGPDRFAELCSRRIESKQPFPDSVWKFMSVLVQNPGKMDGLIEKLRLVSLRLERITHVESSITRRQRNKRLNGGQ